MEIITRLSLALIMFSLFSISYLVTSVSAQGMAPSGIPQADDSSRPIGEGGEGGGPAAEDMSGNMINDGGHGANSGKASDCDYRCTQVAAERELAEKEAPCWPPVLNIEMPNRPNAFMQQLGAIADAGNAFRGCIISVGGAILADHCERLASAVPDEMNGGGNASAEDWEKMLKHQLKCE
jgi:hypothetical protein